MHENYFLYNALADRKVLTADATGSIRDREGMRISRSASTGCASACLSRYRVAVNVKRLSRAGAGTCKRT